MTTMMWRDVLGVVAVLGAVVVLGMVVGVVVLVALIALSAGPQAAAPMANRASAARTIRAVGGLVVPFLIYRSILMITRLSLENRPTSGPSRSPSPSERRIAMALLGRALR
jgi:hypothetical protein